MNPNEITFEYALRVARLTFPHWPESDLERLVEDWGYRRENLLFTPMSGTVQPLALSRETKRYPASDFPERAKR